MDQKDIDAITSEKEQMINSILKQKYCHNNENSIQDIKQRFSKTLEKNQFHSIFEKETNTTIIDILFDTFIPGGSIIFGFGSNRNASLSNCYFVPIQEDSIEGIGKALTENMRVFSWRGGVGNSFEILRPKGTKVNNAANTSSGSVSFMPLFSTATQTIGQNGRRGASIFSHAIWHPDVIDFIKSKSHPEEVFERDTLNNTLPKITGANISVKITGNFMKAYEANAFWQLIFPDVEYENYTSEWKGDLSTYKGPIKTYNIIKAKDLMKQIATSAWTFAEPGVLFWDNILKNTPMAVFPQFVPNGVNPCGEQILPDYGSCNLGAMVLHNFVENPYTSKAKFNFEKFQRHVKLAVEFMDFVISVNKHPLARQNKIDQLGRKIGLGITGLGDCLAMLNLDYGSKESLDMIEKIMSTKAYFEIIASLELAKKLGPAPIFKKKNINNLKHDFAYHLYFQKVNEVARKFITSERNLSEEIETYGLRNVSLSTVAPTGTTSIIMNNCTSGIEPLFAFSYYRKSKLIDHEIRVIHPILFDYLVKNNPKDLDLSTEELVKKYHYVESHTLNYKQRIEVQSLCQRYVTDSISSTVNLPENTTVEQIEDLYVYAYHKGLKGITVYRDNCSLGGILNTENKKEEHKEKTQKLQLSSKEKSTRYQVKWKNTIKTYITVTENEDGIPVEVFTKVPKEAGLEKDTFNPALYLERQSYWDSLCRLTSLLLRYQIPLSDIIKQLDKSSYSMYDLPAILKRTLLDGVKEKGAKDQNPQKLTKCPQCGEKAYVNENGCGICYSCGYSKCG
jgi:ribonucleoside-diphosphate reductase alpha chain